MHDPFAALPGAKINDGSKPKPEIGDYIVEITDCIVGGQDGNFIAEYKIVERNEPGCTPDSSPVGFGSSYVRPTHGEGWDNYLATWLVCALGLTKARDAEKIDRWRPYFGALPKAACSKQVVQGIGPTLAQNGLIGRKMRLIISQGSEPKPGKKYYPRESWFAAT